MKCKCCLDDSYEVDEDGVCVICQPCPKCGVVGGDCTFGLDGTALGECFGKQKEDI